MIDKDSVTPWQLVLLILSVLLLLTMFVETIFKLNIETAQILSVFDNIICFFFLGDFVTRFFKANNKLTFMKWGWLDLISSIPMLNYLRWARIARIVRVIRILRTFRSAKYLISFIFQNRAKSALASAILITLLLVFISAIVILNVETEPTSNIKNSEDALWWSISTVTTVGYGDRYPVTLEGRIVASILMITGIGMVGTISGFVASWFINARKDESN